MWRPTLRRFDSPAELALRYAGDALMGGIRLKEIEEEAGPLESFLTATLAHPVDGGDVMTDADV